ncbi:bifunctional diaminohydroxyphosphoribosylaminopyrimidine deaminase/5-amino-6-(5-phosphoribosylamino)uracil reductase RibD [Bacteroidia bacterium]|nr:bifunctional diaminohydroxyphosphoribosylaminopyrimidine deaminase/5-amino-6-(5-phosphoribosylamino)uracil reductase RibD [Bacteroidia bacterium]
MSVDEIYINRCLELAKQGELQVAPNPMVGCVIVHNGKIVAEGYHEKFGESHAEVNAFDNLSADIDTTQCDVYVSLEPCSHFGNTPPCANLIIEKRPNRLIIGMLDPNKKVAGNGVKIILEAGIDIKAGVLEQECRELNKKFVTAHSYERPYITLKWAETKDGYMARNSNDSSSAKISNSKNDTKVHHFRATHQAILVGAGTVNTDIPSLNVRHGNGNNPIKVVLSPLLSVNTNAKTFSEGKSLIYNHLKSYDTEHIEFVQIKNFNLTAVLRDLFKRNIHSVLIEGGPTILEAVINEKLWDEAIVLKSIDSWGDGKKAPWLGISSYQEILHNNDIFKYFRPL